MKKHVLISLVSAILLIFTACGSGADEQPYIQGLAYNPMYQSQETSSPTIEPTPISPPQCIPDKEPESAAWEENADEPESAIAEFYTEESSIPCRDDLLASAGISEYGWQAVSGFLRDFTSIFTGVNGFYTANRISEIYFTSAYHSQYAFFDRYGNAITDAPWVYTQRFEDYRNGEYCVSFSHHYASYFSLFDFDKTGIPDIIIHFRQTFDGCYGGFYRIFRYENGAYRMLEMAAFSNNEQLDWVSFGSIHELYIDDGGRIITFISCPLNDNAYNHLLLGSRAEFHRLIVPDIHFIWEDWEAHHWEEWERTPYGYKLISSWRDYNPTIFGTDIGLMPLIPFVDLGAELYAYLIR